MARFKAVLFRIPGKGGWTFAPVPESCAPPVTAGWGRTPVIARLGDRSWETSVWREESGRTLLPLPKKIRGALEAGDEVELEIEMRSP